jgi:hypothetical protein
MTEIDYDALEMLPAEEEQAGSVAEVACTHTCSWTCSWTGLVE